MKILAVCGSGIGTSMVLKTKLKHIFEDMNLKVDEIATSNLEDSKALLKKYDLVFCSEKLGSHLGEAKNIVLIKNLLDDSEIISAIKGRI